MTVIRQLPPLRIVSLLPSATEIIAALFSFTKPVSVPHFCGPAGTTYKGRIVLCVGKSHECDHPAAFTATLPNLTSAKTAFSSSRETHDQVQSVFQTENSLYNIDDLLMARLKPDVVVAQDVCKVCSIDLKTLSKSCETETSAVDLAGASHEIRIISVNSKTLTDALETSIAYLGKELDMEHEANLLIQQTTNRLNHLKSLLTPLPSPPRVALIEWIDPLFLGRGWTHELVKIAGGELIGKPGRHADSTLMNMKQGLGDLEFVILCLCGLDVETTVKEVEESRLVRQASWHELTAVVKNQVFIVDGNKMFHRPTPRLLDALEWLIFTLRGQPVPPSSGEFPVLQCDTSKFNPLATTSKLPPKRDFAVEIENCHQAACDRQEAFYTDPKSGLSVMTDYYLTHRQTCCGNACRHCPYAHSRVKDPSRRQNKIHHPVFLNPLTTTSSLDPLRGTHLSADPPPPLIILHWTGTPSSFVTLARVVESNPAQTRVVLLTRVEAHTDQVADCPDTSVPEVSAQALALGLSVCYVPVAQGVDDEDAVQKGIDLICTSVKMNRDACLILQGDDQTATMDEKLWDLCARFNVRVGVTRRGLSEEGIKFFEGEGREDVENGLWWVTRGVVEKAESAGVVASECQTKVIFGKE
ncbi:hypothetical protein HDU98_004016 [Podochytrium sp. JEL0797]|nr:hypothetical protein HDU98_004016 [Podochytrium sp. JEL0797]